MEPKKLSIVIPNFNGENLLKSNLPKVLSSVPEYNTEIIVVDDASTDESVYIVSKLFPDVKIIRNKVNKGFSATVNVGIRASLGEIIVLLNHDVYPDKLFLAPLIKHFDDPSIFAVGCLQRSIEDITCELRGRGIGDFSRGLLVHQRGNVYTSNNTLWVSGGAGAFRKSLWNHLGGLDELYDPFYWEDIDLSYRAMKSGYKILFEKKSIVYHDHRKGAVMRKYSATNVNKIAYRNQLIFFWKNISSLSLCISHILWLPYVHIKFLIQGDTSFYVGFLSALHQLLPVLRQKSHIRKYWILKDELVIKPFIKEMKYA